ncbi:MAG: hypothetical protein PHI12_10885 [Dehalococcoidales bacterium]|nr:hypothetical protein [Dehalococcoidales bacterium]
MASEFIEQCALQYPKPTEFKVGDRVQIVRRVEFRGIWVGTMDATLGCFGTVEGLPAPGYVTVRPDDSRFSWNYPPEALARQVDALPGIMDAVVKRMAMAVSCPPEMMKARWTPEAGGALVFTPQGVSVGDRVVVARKVDAIPWVPEMDGTVGQYGTVIDIGGRDARVELSGGILWYPPGALEVISTGSTSSPVKQDVPVTTKCPNPGWLGTWIDVDRLIIDVKWSGDKPYGPWEAHLYQENGYYPAWRRYSDTWRGPRSEGWVRPEKLKSPLLGRPKARTRVCVPWDPEDMG